jgi:hypothetical protein
MGAAAAVAARTAITKTQNGNELSGRMAIARRFRELLIQQRGRFENYLAVLDAQQGRIKQGNAEELIAYVEFEEQILANIFSLQKVIGPMEAMYQSAGPYFPGDDIPELKTVLEDLKNQAITKTERNKNLLFIRMAEIRIEIKTLRNNPLSPNARRSLYQASNTASLIDIKG